MDALLRRCNTYVRDCVTLYSMPVAQLQERHFVLSADSRPAGEHERRYNRPEGLGLQEISVLVGDEPGNRDIVVRPRAADGPLIFVQDTHRSFLPMHYPLLFPSGENGWDLSQKVRTKNLSASMYIHHRS